MSGIGFSGKRNYYEAQDLLRKYISRQAGHLDPQEELRHYDRLSQAHTDTVLGSLAASPCRKQFAVTLMRQIGYVGVSPTLLSQLAHMCSYLWQAQRGVWSWGHDSDTSRSNSRRHCGRLQVGRK